MMTAEQAEALHKKFVDDGSFDALPQADRYEAGDIVAVRMNGTVYGVLDVRRSVLLLDDGDKHFWCPVADVRPGTEYVEAVRASTFKDATIVVDRKGHAISEKPVRFIHDEWE